MNRSADFEFGAQPFDHKFGHQLRQALAVARDFLDQMRRAEEQPRIREHEYGLDVRAHLLVHLRHLQLVIEISHGAQRTNQHLGADTFRIVDRQAAELVHPRARLEVADDLADYFDALVAGKQRRVLVRIVGDRDDHLVEDRDAAPDNVDMSVVDWVEAAGVDRDQRGTLFGFRHWPKTSVPHSAPDPVAGKRRFDDRRWLQRTRARGLQERAARRARASTVQLLSNRRTRPADARPAAPGLLHSYRP